jgi:NAD(P)-dependent dehydrogenase (short-subunit alcohol dehydrogenase family)
VNGPSHYITVPRIGYTSNMFATQPNLCYVVARSAFRGEKLLASIKRTPERKEAYTGGPVPLAAVYSTTMKIVVITGSTRGIGYGLADAFLHLGCAVTVSSRTPEAVDKAVAELRAKYDAEWVLGHVCDVSEFEQVQSLWHAAKTRFGHVDIWVNNAGLGHDQVKFWELPSERIRTIVSTNVLGTMYGSKVALTGMLKQGFGALYNMEGLGSGNRRVEGTSVYASSKAALRYFDTTLAAELSGTPVITGSLNPGMVATDLITRPYEGRPEAWERAKRIFNIIADPVEAVAPWLAQQMLENDKNGARISRMSAWRVGLRFLAAPFRKRELFDE